MSNSSKDADVPGTHFWCIRKIFTDRNGWPANLFVVTNVPGGVGFVAEALLATKYKTRDEAELAAFDITISNPDLIQKLRIELV